MSGKAKIRYVVQCNRHGVDSTAWAGKQVVVTKPANGAERKGGGCPLCAAEARQTTK